MAFKSYDIHFFSLIQWSCPEYFSTNKTCINDEENERKIKRIEIRDYSNGKQRLAARKL